MIHRLTPEDIRELHQVALELHGGLNGEHEPGLMNLVADKPFMGSGDIEFYPGLFLKAAVYFESLAANQFFCDGNKRTASLCATVFLNLNGYDLKTTNDELYNTALAVANKEIELQDLANWLEDHAIPIRGIGD